ncbi:chromosome segregation protein SMC [Paenibacillus anaericanus]|uniref:Nuclease SbcCD subunit C n=1 Tax=Paenibacillus anaericanus TaxID=170367 RepID=A0A433XVN3_9BACL|nr:chromosome segregation protein SMC [Paenibacillus anaericanus]RUT38527.1 chromosome segregation protein SMC [Paenibacillus anaericanus]
MIPWKMWFTGIRDYQPTVMDLSGKESHILITGPNGAGKSTVTYCMGVVLYSSKVDIEGLKSRNLLPNDTWKAHIRLLFKNEGRMRIDAPTYVEFAVYILQEPGQPTKKEFVIHSGDDPEQWDETIKYTSGDRQYNFTTYKKDLQYKYKIDPDLFYLIWYQQEVNQFAVMDPQERFRIFAEMHGIDQVQRNWEESMEQLKDVNESLRTAEVNVANKKQWLGMARSALERYEDNQKRLVEGGKLYAGALLKLEIYYKQEQVDLVAKEEQLLMDQEIAKDRLGILQEQGDQLNNELKQIQEEKEQLDTKIILLQEQLAVVKKEIEETTIVIGELDIQLKELNQEKSQITRTEEDVHQQLSEITKQLNELNIEIEKAEASLQETEDVIAQILDSSSNLKALIQQDRGLDHMHQERLRQYRSSHDVQMEIDRLDQSIQQSKQEREDKSKLIQELSDEKCMLEQNQLWSTRQRESLSLFKAMGVRAYALNELLELNESARLNAEEQFETIKYAIFFDGSYVQAPNDLYHVPLRSTIPDRSVTEIQTLQIRVKNGIGDDVFPHAVKALWWVEQFFLAGETRIENDVLSDSKGIRGPQEKKSYILSQKAMQKRKEEIQKKISELNTSLASLHDSIKRDTQTMQELHAIIQSVRESEAFLTKKHEREGRILKYEAEMQNLQEQKAHIHEVKTTHIEFIEKRVRLEHIQGILQREADFYVKLGQQKGQFETLQRKTQDLHSLSIQRDTLKQHFDTAEEQVEQIEGNERRQQRNFLNNQDEIQRASRTLNQIDNQIKDTKEALDTSKINLLTVTEDIENLKGVARFIYDEVDKEFELETNFLKKQQSLAKLRQEYESGKVTFNSARNESGIDPAAPENYKVIEEEVHRLQDEYKRTSLLFEENQERAEKLKDQLETTINMRVLEIQQRFKNYMSIFQFEGQIDWNQQEDRRGRVLFHLFIKARKEGHRGTLEDVSVKARGGRVGKGVSGGEESLSSLLFALALLQNLQTAPGFIVMDEFDSALDEQRKLKVFDLYAGELQRKLIILSPKSHENSYLDRFSKAYIVHHDPTVPRSKVTGLVLKRI